jgi:hypothetical protein
LRGAPLKRLEFIRSKTSGFCMILIEPSEAMAIPRQKRINERKIKTNPREPGFFYNSPAAQTGKKKSP